MNQIPFIGKDDAKFEAKNPEFAIMCAHGLNVSASVFEEYW
jgi:hypothetical protein